MERIHGREGGGGKSKEISEILSGNLYFVDSINNVLLPQLSAPHRKICSYGKEKGVKRVGLGGMTEKKERVRTKQYFLTYPDTIVYEKGIRGQS